MHVKVNTWFLELCRWFYLGSWQMFSLTFGKVGFPHLPYTLGLLNDSLSKQRQNAKQGKVWLMVLISPPHIHIGVRDQNGLLMKLLTSWCYGNFSLILMLTPNVTKILLTDLLTKTCHCLSRQPLVLGTKKNLGDLLSIGNWHWQS